MTSFTPTDEQRNALALFQTGESLAIQAGAGTGKTSELVLCAESTDRRGQYVAFNKAIVEESKAKMPGHVACNTAHSLAFRIWGKRYRHRLNSSRMKSLDIANRVGLSSFAVTTQDGQRKLLGAGYLAGLTMRTVTRFCQSADREPDARRHAPYIDGIDIPPVRDGRRNYDNNMLVRQVIQPAVVRAWADLQDVHGSLPFRHDHYLKMWQLNDPVIPVDFILFDEAQDANPVMVAAVAEQQERGVQLVWVGDSQQQIYSFTGAVNALDRVPADHQAYLTQSFRFGPAIAEVANDVLARLDAPLRLSGTEGIASTVGPCAAPTAILTRTNAEAVRTVLGARENGKRPHLVGGAGEFRSFAKGADDLMRTGRTGYPELACFDSWQEVREYVQQDEQGGELRLGVRLIDEFGVDVILDTLDRMPREDRSDLIVSTAHKSKGREWDRVKLGNDFPPDAANEELRLLYVASTRAKLQLDNTAVTVPDPETGAAPLRGNDTAECISCGEQRPRECPDSQRECGHHCNHSWTHDRCCWCTPAGAALQAAEAVAAPGAGAGPPAASQAASGAQGDACEVPAGQAARLEVLVPRGNAAHRPLTQLARSLDWSRERAHERLTEIDGTVAARRLQIEQLQADMDELQIERLLLVSLCEPEKQAHYEEGSD